MDIASGRLFFAHRTFVLFNEERVLSDLLCHVKVYLLSLVLSLIITIADSIVVAVLCWTKLDAAEGNHLRTHAWHGLLLLFVFQPR